jgi:hypothetical protein
MPEFGKLDASTSDFATSDLGKLDAGTSDFATRYLGNQIGDASAALQRFVEPEAHFWSNT